MRDVRKVIIKRGRGVTQLTKKRLCAEVSRKLLTFRVNARMGGRREWVTCA
jgi:hypothetical protein